MTMLANRPSISRGHSPSNTQMSSRIQRSRRGGSWLVTYADLMTILVCFFVLIVSFSIQDQVKLEVVAGSMRDAFGVAEERRFAGDVEMIGTPDQLQPGNVRPAHTPTASAIDDTLTARPAAGSTGHQGAFESKRDARLQLQRVASSFEAAILTHPLLKDQSQSIQIAMVEDGLQILLVDSDGFAMFEPGQSQLTSRAESLLRELTAMISPLPNLVSIEGHADANGQGEYSAFELTILRADHARQVLQAAGLPETRIIGVTGRGGAAPLYADDPYAAANRRVEILLKPAAPLLPPERSL